MDKKSSSKSNVSNFLVLLLMMFFLGIVLYYFFWNPEHERSILNCPFKLATGLDCPGCGSQRAFHALLRGNISGVFQYNLLFFPMLFYCIGFLVFNFGKLKLRFEKIYQFLYGKYAIAIIILITVFYTIYRNM